MNKTLHALLEAAKAYDDGSVGETEEASVDVENDLIAAATEWVEAGCPVHTEEPA